MDAYGNYIVGALPSHHVFVDDRNFFSRYLHGERLKAEKEARVEAFKFVKEVACEEIAKY